MNSESPKALNYNECCVLRLVVGTVKPYDSWLDQKVEGEFVYLRQLII